MDGGKDFEKWLQRRLTSHSFSVGMIDGDIGPTTVKAIRAFQASQGLEPTGEADALTVSALRLTSIGAAPRPETIANAAGIAATKTVWPKQTLRQDWSLT